MSKIVWSGGLFFKEEKMVLIYVDFENPESLFYLFIYLFSFQVLSCLSWWRKHGGYTYDTL